MKWGQRKHCSTVRGAAGTQADRMGNVIDSCVANVDTVRGVDARLPDDERGRSGDYLEPGRRALPLRKLI